MNKRHLMLAVLTCVSTMNVCASHAVAAQKPIPAVVHPYNCKAEVNPEILQQGDRDYRQGMVGKRFIRNIAVKGEGGVAVRFKEPVQLKEVRFSVEIPRYSDLRLVVNGTDRATKAKVSIPIKIATPALIERSNKYSRIDVEKGTQKDPSQLDVTEIKLFEQNDPSRRGKPTDYLRIDFIKVGDGADNYSEPNELSFEVVKCD